MKAGLNISLTKHSRNINHQAYVRWDAKIQSNLQHIYLIHLKQDGCRLFFSPILLENFQVKHLQNAAPLKKKKKKNAF